jgi:hypothetical protein
MARGALFLLGVILVASAFSKVIDETGFAAMLVWQTSSIPLGPGALRVMMAVVVCIEAIVGCALVAGWINRVSIVACAVLLLIYTAALARMALDPVAPGSCGCGAVARLDGLFGGGATASLWRSVVLLAVLIAAASVPRFFARSDGAASADAGGGVGSSRA